MCCHPESHLLHRKVRLDASTVLLASPNSHLCLNRFLASVHVEHQAIKSSHGACWFLLLPLPFNWYFYQLIYMWPYNVSINFVGSVYSRGFDIYFLQFSVFVKAWNMFCVFWCLQYVRVSCTNVGIDVKSMQFDSIVRKGNTIHIYM